MIEVLAQATDQATQAAAQPGGITGSIQGGLGCLGAAIGVGIVGMKEQKQLVETLTHLEPFLFNPSSVWHLPKLLLFILYFCNFITIHFLS